MRALTFRSILLATAFALAGCGGGGDTDIASTPPPPPPPPPVADGIIGAVIAGTPSQEFAVEGAAFEVPEGSEIVEGPFAGSSGELKIRYDGASQDYEVQLPGGSTWNALVRESSYFYQTAGADSTAVTVIESVASGYTYSALATWWNDASGLSGDVAFGIPTPAGGVPATGTANYAGTISGQSTGFSDALDIPVSIGGTVNLAFDFGAGTLSGSIHAMDTSFEGGPDLGILNFTDTVYSTGSLTFSGRFDTALAGPNEFSGLFTGPQAQELIGKFVFPYPSPVEGQPYIAAGAWVAKK